MLERLFPAEEPEPLIQPMWPEDFAEAVIKALGEQLPTTGSIRGPDGFVHDIIGDFTVCDQQWARSTPRGVAVPLDGWNRFSIAERLPVSCMVCLGER